MRSKRTRSGQADRACGTGLRESGSGRYSGSLGSSSRAPASSSADEVEDWLSDGLELADFTASDCGSSPVDTCTPPRTRSMMSIRSSRWGGGMPRPVHVGCRFFKLQVSRLKYNGTPTDPYSTSVAVTPSSVAPAPCSLLLVQLTPRVGSSADRDAWHAGPGRSPRARRPPAARTREAGKPRDRLARPGTAA
jgi:hypothetical protein